MKQSRFSIAGERRLAWKGDIGQFGRDVRDFHLRTDGTIETAGSVVMAPVATIAKLPNALVGALGGQEAAPLSEGPLAYMRRDAGSAVSNLLGGIVTLKIGKVLKGAFDVVDLVTVDPLLDAGSAVFGHTRKKVHTALAA